jgi:hypothetical protein
MKLDVYPINRPTFAIEEPIVRVRATFAKITKFKFSCVGMSLVDFLESNLGTAANNQIAQNLSRKLSIVFGGLFRAKDLREEIGGITKQL